jgi:hypothetical protein
MRHASIQTTMNVYGRAMTDGKRQAHGNVVEMILKPAGSPTNTPEAEAEKQRLRNRHLWLSWAKVVLGSTPGSS